MSAKRLSVLERALFFYLPALVLVVSFVAVCIQAGTAWPWDRIVHEDGQHTFLGTVFYFEHATRELLLDAVLALAIAGAVRSFYPVAEAEPALPRARFALAIATLASVALILGGTAYINAFGPSYAGEARGQSILENLAQYPTRPGAPFVWGAHWRYHLIERFAEVALAFFSAGLVWLRDGRPSGAEPPGLLLYAATLLVFAVATMVFGIDALPFRDPVYLGHQLRELLTHTLITLPLALGLCFVLARRFSRPAAERSSFPLWPIGVAGAIAFLGYAYVLAGAVLLKAQAYGQKKALADLVFPHFFEHSLGYLFVCALAGLLYLWPTLSRASIQHRA